MLSLSILIKINDIKIYNLHKYMRDCEERVQKNKNYCK